MPRKLKVTQDVQPTIEAPVFEAGDSIDRLIKTFPVNSIYYETDTGDRWRFTVDKQWEKIDNIHP